MACFDALPPRLRRVVATANLNFGSEPALRVFRGRLYAWNDPRAAESAVAVVITRADAAELLSFGRASRANCSHIAARATVQPYATMGRRPGRRLPPGLRRLLGPFGLLAEPPGWGGDWPEPAPLPERARDSSLPRRDRRPFKGAYQ